MPGIRSAATQPSIDPTMALTILLTGFGPFPGAPFNPTGALVRRLARKRRPAFADVHLTAHVFPTSYRAVDCELAQLISDLAPDAILMFGLAARARTLRVETRARNALSMLTPDAEGHLSAALSIAPGEPAALSFNVPVQRLVLAARAARVPAQASRNAGRYLCNYLCWHAIKAAGRPEGPRLVAFIHVPKVRPAVRRRSGRPSAPSLDELLRAGEAILLTIATITRRSARMKKT
jgi:pyroglutamyl-peptidase